MRYTKIELAGDRGNATLARSQDGATVEITIRLAGGGERVHTVQADDEGDRWSMAGCLQQTLEGYRGCGGDIREYARAIDLIAGA